VGRRGVSRAPPDPIEEERAEDRRGIASLLSLSGRRIDRRGMPPTSPKSQSLLVLRQNFKFLYGDTLEVLLLFLAKESGHEVTHEQYEVEADGVKGHTDAVIDGVPVDCKSASPSAYAKFENGQFVFDDPFGYISNSQATPTH
jgi:hypothetical protein